MSVTHYPLSSMEKFSLSNVPCKSETTVTRNIIVTTNTVDGKCLFCFMFYAQ